MTAATAHHCRNCGRHRKRRASDNRLEGAKELCWGCYHRWRESGFGEEIPPPKDNGLAARKQRQVERYARLLAQGLTRPEAALRMGIAVRTEAKYAALLRDLELPETVPPAPVTVSGWITRAACGPATAHLFYEYEGERHDEREAREAGAKAICAGCPVRRECLDDALARGERWGIRGGLTEDERDGRDEREGVAA
jgi:WhiB family transcriptional regulator, redox-sensing transcriptional regulator